MLTRLSATAPAIIILLASGLGLLMPSFPTLTLVDNKAGGPGLSLAPTFSDWVKHHDTDPPVDGIESFDFPAVLGTLPDGTIYTVYRNAHSHSVSSLGKLMFTKSTDGGLTFTTPVVIFDTPGNDDRNHGGGTTDQGTILIWLTRLHTNEFGWIRSTDGGVTFSSFQSFGEVFGDARPPLIVIPEMGKVGMIGTGGVGEHGGGDIKIAWSVDDGVSLSRIQTVVTPALTVEASGLYLGNGRILIWWHSSNVGGGDLWNSLSSDFGATWTHTNTGIPHGVGNHGSAMTLVGDRLFVIWRHASAPSKPMFSTGLVNDILADPTTGWETGELGPPGKVGDGYGGVVPLPDGRVLMAYAFEDDPIHISDHDIEYRFASFGAPPPPPGWKNAPPTVNNPITTDERTHNVTYSREFSASDPDANQTLLWTIHTDASFLGVTGQNRTVGVNGTPIFSDTNQEFYVNVTVADQGCRGGCNLTDFVNYTLYINNSLPTIINAISSDSGRVNQAYSRDFDHLDMNGDTVVWALDSDASFLSIDQNGVVSGTPDAPGQYYVNATTFDFISSGDFVNYTLTIQSEWSNTAPSLDSPKSTAEGTHNVTFSHEFSASDIDVNQTLLWSLESNATFLVLDGQNRTAWINGIPAFPDRDRFFYATVTVADQGCGGSCSLTAFVNLTLYINNTEPTITNKIYFDAGSVGQVYSRDLDHLDVNGDIVTWALFADASFLTIYQNGTVSGTPDRAGSYYVNATVGDGRTGDFLNYTLNVRPDTRGQLALPFSLTSSYEMLGEEIVRFTAGVDPPGSYTFLWEFGDGEVSDQQNPAHRYGYGLSAKFDVRLTVCSEEQCTVASQQVTLIRWTYLGAIVGILLLIAIISLVRVVHAVMSVNRALKGIGPSGK